MRSDLNTYLLQNSKVRHKRIELDAVLHLTGVIWSAPRRHAGWPGIPCSTLLFVDFPTSPGQKRFLEQPSHICFIERQRPAAIPRADLSLQSLTARSPSAEVDLSTPLKDGPTS